MSKIIIPNEIMNTILEFSGFHKFRNGKFMKQIDKTTRSYRRIKKYIGKRDPFQSYATLKISKTTSIILLSQHQKIVGRL